MRFRAGRLFLAISCAMPCGAAQLARAEMHIFELPKSKTSAEAPASPAPETPTGPLTWLDSRDAAIIDAQKNQRPILAVMGSVTCPSCRALQQEILKPAAQQKLAQWTRLYVDVDDSPEVARAFAVASIPALRIMTANGRVVASTSGLMSADELVKWLDEHGQQAGAKVSPQLLESTVPDDATLKAVVAQLGGNDALTKEAAIRRLTPFPRKSAPAVVDVFSSGDLNSRLAAMELLERWHAPLDEIDPWLPESITPERLQTLKQWAQTVKEPSAAKELSEIALPAVRNALKKLIEASTIDDAQVIRARLSHWGEMLLPEVYSQLEQATTDQARERLTALRYHLVASAKLTLGWPGGIDRLASSQSAIRQQAVDELAQRVTSEDSRLLLELFSDPDPLIRERTLRLMQSAGGAQTQEALVKLLQDPEANVRAAVLKQLAEAPQPQMVPEIVKYLSQEKDAALIGHAVRVLREAKSAESIPALKELMKHSDWRVRAEAIEALQQLISPYDSAISQEEKANVLAAIIKLLEDEDGFVVSRAATALAGARLASAIDPMIKATVKHPDLAPQMIELLKADKALGAMAVRQLRELLKHEKPEVRAAGIKAMSLVAPKSSGESFRDALKDESRRVQLAAADAIFVAINAFRPEKSTEQHNTSGIARLFSSRGQPDLNKWLEQFRSGASRPAWVNESLPGLKELATSAAPEERLSAAMVLCAVGEESEYLPVVMSIAHSDAKQRSTIAQVLPWLPWEARLSTFDELTGLAGDDAMQSHAILTSMLVIPDDRAVAAMWKMLEQPDAESKFERIHATMASHYFGDRYMYDERSVTSAQREAAAKSAKEFIDTGNEYQRLAALIVLVTAARDEVKAAAQKMYDDASLPDALRADALQVMLATMPKDEARKKAVEAVADPKFQRIALAYLSMGSQALRELRGMHVLPWSLFSETYTYVSGSETRKIDVPEGLPLDALKKVLAESTDPTIKPYAGYLLAISGDRSGVDPVVQHWRNSMKEDDQWRQLVYRAVTMAADDELTPVLDEVYATYDKSDYQLREFYWTIRSLKGEKILKLRKKIRDEVGMDRLR